MTTERLNEILNIVATRYPDDEIWIMTKDSMRAWDEDNDYFVELRKHGKWILTLNEDYRCSECELITSSYKANYCPNCGSRMSK